MRRLKGCFPLIPRKKNTDKSCYGHALIVAGSRGMAGGQAIDLAAIGATLSSPELEFMHIHKPVR